MKLDAIKLKNELLYICNSSQVLHKFLAIGRCTNDVTLPAKAYHLVYRIVFVADCLSLFRHQRTVAEIIYKASDEGAIPVTAKLILENDRLSGSPDMDELSESDIEVINEAINIVISDKPFDYFPASWKKAQDIYVAQQIDIYELAYDAGVREPELTHMKEVDQLEKLWGAESKQDQEYIEMLTLNQIKVQMWAYRDIYGNSLKDYDEIDNCESKNDCEIIIEKHRTWLEDKLSDAQSSLDKFKWTLGVSKYQK